LCIHKPVMLAEVLSFLSPAPGKRVLDATVGAGRHGVEIQKRIVPGGLIVGLDRDPCSLTLARHSFREAKAPEDSWRLFHLSYRDLDRAAGELGLGDKGFDGILFDLGVASPQIDDPERGFSFLKEGPVDFRFDRSQSLTGRDIVNRWPMKELRRIFREYGNEPKAAAIARRICRVRHQTAIETTTQLADIVRKSIPPRNRTTRRNPATLVFQALRIAVNDELGALSEGLEKALCHLAPGGVCVVLSYHSGEDRIVKRSFLEASRRKEGDVLFERLTKKPLVATDEETRENPRSRSAKLRALRRLLPGEEKRSKKKR